MTPIGHVGYHHIRAKTLEEIDEEINTFFNNPLIKDVKDIKVDTEVQQHRMTGELAVSYVAHIVFYYDKEMWDRKEEEEDKQATEESNQLALEIKGDN